MGIDHVGLGSDYDGATMPSTLAKIEHVPKLLSALKEEGLSQDELEKFAYKNWFRVIAQTWKR